MGLAMTGMGVTGAISLFERHRPESTKLLLVAVESDDRSGRLGGPSTPPARHESDYHLDHLLPMCNPPKTEI